MSSHQKRISANWMSTQPNDMLGTPFHVGDRFVKAVQSGRSCSIEVWTVSRIEDGKIYANGSKVKINYPGRCLIVNELFLIEDETE